MRLDHLSFAAGPDGLAATAERIGELLGTTFVDGGVHPRFGTRNMVLPLAGDTYLEVVEVLDHPASDKAPFGQAVRARSALGGGWLGWVVAVDDITVVEHRLGREAVIGNRHRPDGTELRWKQIGVNGLIADPQLPFFIQWEVPAELHPSHGADGSLLPGLPRDRRRLAARQRVARRDRRGAARGREGRVGRTQRHPRRHRRAGADARRPGADLTACRPGDPPESQHLAPHRDLRGREPRRRPRRPAVGGDALAGDWTGRDVLDIGCGTGFHLPRFAATARDGRRGGAACRPGRRSPGGVPAHWRTVDRAPGHSPRRCRCPTRRSTSCTPDGRTSSGPAASPGWPSSTGSYAAAAWAW